ncbi:Daunorubicin/doxorubicin resistance ATP-binding protein DrrA [Candidatus Arcanobacter lacustris]|uniref:Daunorubicin/doxorubicin resistance ATP-binding protein DrrA n=1 Tax=Candidatus Arcanibacter lacustris TaxID=1607817 RepID=A0A0F5MNW7_9RICK|nr:Daunorubicin/doxorubicin resistance ATP-binding protein DrrA [Candidatus Arcanobacter lacustris]
MLALEIENLKKIYQNGYCAVDNINLKIEEGDFFGVLGPNGAGKSTTINILSSLITKTSGNISVLGYSIDKDPLKVKSLLGIIPQEINLSLHENIVDILVTQAGFYGVPRKIALERAEKYLILLELWDKRNNISRNLSGGMKRRLMIARALMHDPKILILDEPTAGVDIEIRHLIWELLSDLNKSGKTILLTSHYLEEVERLCNNIAIIHHGLIVENGRVADILNKLDEEVYVLHLQEDAKQTQLTNEHMKLTDSKTIELSVFSSSNLGKIIADLVANNIKIKSISNKINRLEKFFLQVTKN